MNRLIWVSGEGTDTFAALTTAARVQAATHNGEHKGQAPDEDIRPVARYRTLEVLFLLCT